MCGITGIFNWKTGAPVDRNRLAAMTDKLFHRGPDDDGCWIDDTIGLGHRRLSIIDLTDAAHQPMIYRDQYVLTYNGEIYNYVELRDELKKRGHHFTSTGDTEVVIAAFSEWGTDCINRFVGMWSFAIWDKEKSRLFCSRDRFGIKPFHYMENDRGIYFASEAKALFDLLRDQREVNRDQLQRFMQLGWVVYRDETLVKQVKNLPPAHNMVVDKGGVKVYRYWDLTEFESDHRSFAEKADEFEHRLRESIRLHMRSDVPVGGCLSGGLDSSSIVSLVMDEFPEKQFNTFTAYYSFDKCYDERQYARCYSSYKRIHQFFTEPQGDELLRHFRRMHYFQDFPIGGSSVLSQYFVMKLASEQGMKVLLDGQGADEILSGYHHYFLRMYARQLKRLRWRQLLWDLIKYKKEQGQNAGFMMAQLLKSILLATMSAENYYQLAAHKSQPNLLDTTGISKKLIDLPTINASLLGQTLYHELFYTNLPNLLHFEDRNSMAFSIESRVPFLDHRLVEFCFKLMPEDHMQKTETKRLLRRAMGGILPDEINNRKDKIGFVAPGEQLWLRNELASTIQLEQLDGNIWNMDAVKRNLQTFREGKSSNGTPVWRLASYIQWKKQMESGDLSVV